MPKCQIENQLFSVPVFISKINLINTQRPGLLLGDKLYPRKIRTENQNVNPSGVQQDLI